MPLYDRACDAETECGWWRLDCYEPINAPDPGCPECGGPTARVWLMGQRHRVTIIGDDIPGGMTLDNLGHEPVTVYSRTELKRIMDARGLQHFVRHVGEQGSDKSKHTTRWI